jgi:hypothetical protein
MMPRVRRCAQWEAERLARIVVAWHHPRQCVDAPDVACALGHRDRAARIEQIERVRRLQIIS